MRLKPGLLKFILVPIVGLLMAVAAAYPVQAGSADIQFSGVVSKKSPQGMVASYPRVLVSFTDQITLPTSGTGISPEQAVVFDGSGNPVVVKGVVNLASGGSKSHTALLVPLSISSTQAFLICEQGTGRCVRYTVQRH